MTEYELADAAGTFFDIGISSLMGYFSVFTAYLITAYLVGSKLKKQQVLVITGLFLVMQFFLIWGAAGFFWQARIYMDQIRPAALGNLKPHHVALFLLSTGVLAGLKFMWDVRHPKTE
jgi:hypothetical protein